MPSAVGVSVIRNASFLLLISECEEGTPGDQDHHCNRVHHLVSRSLVVGCCLNGQRCTLFYQKCK